MADFGGIEETKRDVQNEMEEGEEEEDDDDEEEDEENEEEEEESCSECNRSP